MRRLVPLLLLLTLAAWAAEVDVTGLDRLPQTEFQAVGPHRPGQPVTYRGVRLAALMPADAARVQLWSTEGFFVELTRDEVQQGALLATRIDGVAFKPDAPEWHSAVEWRNPLGPVALAYPNEPDPWRWVGSINRMRFVADAEAWGAPVPETAVKGYEIARTTCLYCHSLKRVGGEIGPALDTILPRRGRDFVRRYVRNPRELDPKSEMPRLSDMGRTFTDDQLERILDFLEAVSKR